ncbi:TIM-barrel domain-containing protein [Sphingomonas sp. MMS12-HWE2-04]|uniref:glycoside hydrolase family 31 protein n=1 Tax=Sphingomonas sp. MMS12-HWE2-04 TaxID=3234199 RepID=UPI00384ED04E
MTIVTKHSLRALLIAGASLLALPAVAQPMASLDRHGAVVAVEPYAANVVRVTISLDRALSDSAPGYGVSAKPDTSGWAHHADASGDVFTSSALAVTVNAQPWPKAPSQMERYFAPSLPPVSIAFRTPGGETIAEMNGWEMAPQTVNGEKTFKVGASFAAPGDEHYYGLGQNQEGKLDLKGRTIDCRHNYDAPAGETVCIPVLLTNKGYAVVWDNPATTTISPGLHGSTHWQSQVGERVSFFLIQGKTTDEIMAGYAKLTGDTPLPPKAAFGLIQSKARYESQKELLGIAEGYRSRGYPLDVMVLDWFYWTRMGQIDIDRNYFPDPAAMNKQLHDQGMHTVISVWPRFERESRYFDFLRTKDWLLKDGDGKVADGLPVRSDRAGALLDSTNPEARKWFWGTIRDNILNQGFDWLWLDETEPDLVPDGNFYSIGSGDRYHNVFPLVHTAVAAEGSAKDRPDFRNLILARAAYLGTQHSGAIFWSSDIKATWEALRRQVSTGLNFTASGHAYWSSDTGGWQWPSGPKAERPVLLDPAGATAMGPDYKDYPELFTRWFAYNTFTPTLRIHGQRPATAIWEYGTAAEPVLAKFLRLRYALIPYLYALGYQTYRTNAPFMRGLFMDFPNDPNVADMGDEYMFGPAFLVAPVTEQGVTSRKVYLPQGADWYDYWTNEKHAGGQWVTADAPIDRIPLFVRAGSIVPMGAQVPNTSVRQPLESIRVYPGRDASFTLFDDDGVTNAYRKGAGKTAVLRWDEGAQRLTASGKLPTGQDAASLVRVIGKGAD